MEKVGLVCVFLVKTVYIERTDLIFLKGIHSVSNGDGISISLKAKGKVPDKGII